MFDDDLDSWNDGSARDIYIFESLGGMCFAYFPPRRSGILYGTANVVINLEYERLSHLEEALRTISQ